MNMVQVLATAVLALALASPDVRAQNVLLTEEQIKAGFLFNFTKFVEWPPESFADANAPIVIGIVGDSAVEKLLMEVAAGKSVNGRPVLVKHFKDLQDVRNCQIVFVGSSDEKRMPQILEALKASSVLSVGETPGFIPAGGMINFFIEDNKVRLEINLDAATRARVKISAKVIAVGRLVAQNAGKGQI
jgi:YfiR/HmsC-like